MLEVLVRGQTLPEAYHEALKVLYTHGVVTPCTDYNTTQKELSMTMAIAHPLQEPMISKFFIGGFHELEQYRQEMLDGILDFEIAEGNWNYTYHNRMVRWGEDVVGGGLNQIDFVIKELKRNPSSRRAVIDVRDNYIDEHSGDPACLQHIQYFIRNNKLDCDVLFRSNDAVKATMMNAFALIMLQKKIADALEIEVGTYTHRANSFHCYERDFGLLSGYVKRMENSDDTTYCYKGEWEDLMEAEKPSIAAMVKELKERD